MADSLATAFESNAQKFDNYDKELRGYIRYAVIRRNLEPFLTGAALRIADIGGGAAKDAIWAAGLGHNVTVVEPAVAQLELAKQKIAQQSAGIQNRITLVQGTAADVMAEHGGSFDMVFCHCVAMYLDNPGQLIDQLVKLLKPGGHLSLLEKGYYGSIARLVAEHRFDDLKRIQAEHKVMNNQGRDVHAFVPEQLAQMIEATGAQVLEWSGVRVITEGMRDQATDFSAEQLAAVVEAEHQQGHDPAIRGQGQLLHLIAQKQA